MRQRSPIPERSSGVLLHPTSLPGGPIGDLGEAAYRFVDWLAAAGQRYWQILPLVPVDPGGSPYNGLSALAGNPLLISAERLVAEGLLEADTMAQIEAPGEGRLDYRGAEAWKSALLRAAHGHFQREKNDSLHEEFANFHDQNRSWLADYALFRALRDQYRGSSWRTWPEEIRHRQPSALAESRSFLENQIERYAFEQFLFDRQWRALRKYANMRGIELIGDIPIFVAYDSADVWASPEIFKLDESGSPIVVSGVPPDYFSVTGQRWGNPIYRWDFLEQRGFDWWVERFRRTLEAVNVARIDHFRGFEAYWEIDSSEATAVNGHWVPGPGQRFFDSIENQLGGLPLIAEDLGLITPEVEQLRVRLGYPGMRVLQFAFDGDPGNVHLPENHPVDSVAYTGTHDNATIRGWWEDASDEERRRASDLLGTRDPTNWDFIEAVFASRASLAIVPIQDVLGLGAVGRMNTPGQPESNWTWRLTELPSAETGQRLRELTGRSGRREGI
jgi:4-alpha-glucanotransferase